MKTYYLKFASGDPRLTSGLSPTFLSFNTYGVAVAPPGITSVIGATGFYAFQYGTTTPIVFLADGATSGLADNVRYVTGSIDPADRSDEYGTTIVAQNTTLLAFGSTLVSLGTTGVAIGISNIALGTTGVAIGISLSALGNTILAGLGGGAGPGLSLSTEILSRLGSTLSTFGTASVDPVDVFGYLKRMQEFNEGNQQFTKTSGAWQINSRGGSLLATKSLSNSSTTVTKS